MAIDFSDDEDGDEGLAAPSMNTTPLIDVLLVLLVMLIITIPIRLHSVSMDLPAGLPPPDAAIPVVVRLEVSAANQVSWNGAMVADRAMLELLFKAAAKEPEPPEIHVRADPKTKYDTVAAILTLAQQQGLQKIGVVGLEVYGKPAGAVAPTL
jgi:biopolymer transport protein ExbD